MAKKREERVKTVKNVRKEAEFKKSDGKASRLIAFVFGLVAILTCYIPFVNAISIILAIAGFVFSIIALKRCEKKGLAIAAIILNILAILIGIVILLVAGTILLYLTSGGGSDANRNYTNYSIGDKISTGNISITVLSADKSKQIKNSQNQLIPLQTNGYFLSVKINIENRDIKAKTILGDSFTIVDNKGRAFSALSNAEKYYTNSISNSDPNTGSGGAQVQPGIMFSGIKIFEIPEDSTSLNLKIALSNKEGAYVNLNK